MKKGFDNNDFINGNEYIRLKKNGEVLRGKFEKVRGENYISKDHICPCGKDTYDSYEKAKKALKLRNKTNKEIYKCEICGYWHFTSKDGKGNKHRKYDKKQRNVKITVNDYDLKEFQKFKKDMKNKPSYYKIIK